jgi:hypothetical protein
MATEVQLKMLWRSLMSERSADTAVLGLVSVLYSMAVFFLKLRKA